MKTGLNSFLPVRLALLFFISVISFNCKKEDAAKQPDPDPVPVSRQTDVYAGGFERDDAGYQIAKIWKNGIATSLTSDGDDAWVRSITVSGNDVYAVGILIQGGSVTGSEPTFPKLWKNGVEIPMMASGETFYGATPAVLLFQAQMFMLQAGLTQYLI